MLEGLVVGGSWGSGRWFLVWGRVCGWFMCASALDSACETGLKEKTGLIRILYCISKAIQPYRHVTNTLIKLLNENAYKQKEEVVEGLRKIAFTESKH